MHIVHLASEFAPIAKVGGLADVVYGLSHALQLAGHKVSVIIPKYDCCATQEIAHLHPFLNDLICPFNGEQIRTTVWSGTVDRVQGYFIEAHNTSQYFNRQNIYGSPDDMERFTFFCRAALEFLLKAKIFPDILHLHDWQTALVPTLIDKLFHKTALAKSRCVLTVHNFDYQGLCSPNDLNRVGLKGFDLLTPSKFQDLHHPDLVNILKGGLLSADAITTVSPTYAKEVKTPLGGRGLDRLLKNEKKFSGILNGIDYDYWNPQTDRYLPATYNTQNVRQARQENKQQLQKRLKLTQADTPLVAFIGRLIPQKGLEMVKQALVRSQEQHCQFILLGTSPIPEIAHEFQSMQMHLSNHHPSIRLLLEHHEELSHWIYGGADILMVPSLFEPCGLTQMLALRYGAIPIARKTGGLADTVFDIDHSHLPSTERNGYLFEEPTPHSFNEALDRALNCWHHHPERWQQLQLNGMQTDLSWKVPAEKYLQLYAKILGH